MRRTAIVLYILTSLVGPWGLVANGALPWIAAPALWATLLFIVPGIFLHLSEATKLARMRRSKAAAGAL